MNLGFNMKRKLNADDVPTPVPPNVQENKTSQTFEDLGLDSRILQAIAKEGFISPTPVQAQSVPLALEGKDILGQSCLITFSQTDGLAESCSSCKYWIRQNCCVCPSDPERHPTSESRRLFASLQSIVV